MPAGAPYDSIEKSRWLTQRVNIAGSPSTPTDVTINYLSCPPPEGTSSRGTILLIHGYPETWYQFRHVITPLSDAGYHVIAPDYRGAGTSSHPRDGYDKVTMATDIHTLLTKHLGIKEKVHVVGHDIGGMVAHAYAARFPDDSASVTWGECPLPGTKTYDRFVKEDSGVWHFTFHWQTDLPETLTFGRERQYIKHFYDRLCINANAFRADDIDYYASLFAQPGAMRSGFDVYRGFHQDCIDNKKWMEDKGKCPVPCMTLNGDGSFLSRIAEEQALEMYTDVKAVTVAKSGHWIAEENPESFIDAVLKFVGK